MVDESDVNRHFRVLVVDDNKVIREMVTRQLAKLGVLSETAVDGKDALERLTSEDFDIVLMDVQMPEMDGMAATQEIRRLEQETSKHKVIIALTGHGSRLECLQSGMDDYIAKPMNIATLRAMLQKWAPSINFVG